MKDERVYLGHIHDAINDIEQYTSVGRDAFVAERTAMTLSFASSRSLERPSSSSPMRRRTVARRSRGSRSPACAIASRMITSVWISHWSSASWSVICLR